MTLEILWGLEPATAAKHRLYKRYLDAWWPKLLQPSRTGYLQPRVTYLDAFAGPGRYKGGEQGSPVFVLHRLLGHAAVDRMRLSKERVRMVFIEKERDRYDFLKAELYRHFGPLDELPIRVDVRCGEAARDSEDILTEVGAWGAPILAIFDSWGNVRIPYETMRRISHNRSSEVITTLGPNWFSRRENVEPEKLDIVFGGRAYWRAAEKERRPEEKWRVWLSIYRDSLRRAGFQFQLHFKVVPRTGQPLYLVFGTGHPAGVEVMKDAMWEVDGVEGMGFEDPRTRGARPVGQLSLFDQSDDGLGHELLELVGQRLSSKPATVEELAEWLLTETSRWRRKDARQAVKQLQREMLVLTEPPGRLTSSTVVRLA